jgi:hypothetical protein
MSHYETLKRLEQLKSVIVTVRNQQLATRAVHSRVAACFVAGGGVLKTCLKLTSVYTEGNFMKLNEIFTLNILCVTLVYWLFYLFLVILTFCPNFIILKWT